MSLAFIQLRTLRFRVNVHSATLKSFTGTGMGSKCTRASLRPKNCCKMLMWGKHVPKAAAAAAIAAARLLGPPAAAAAAAADASLLPLLSNPLLLLLPLLLKPILSKPSFENPLLKRPLLPKLLEPPVLELESSSLRPPVVPAH